MAGERAIDPEGVRLLEATAEAVAAAYELPPLDEPVIGLIQQVYWDSSDATHWAPLTLAVLERKAIWCAEHGRTEILWWPYELDDMEVELPLPEVEGDPALNAVCEAFLAYVADGEDEDVLVGQYFLALAARLHARFGMPVVTEDPDGGVVGGPDAQALAQLAPEERAAWEARGWIGASAEPELHPGTVLSVPLPDGRVAGIYRLEQGLFATEALSPWCGGTGLDERVTTVGRDPGVVAGLLPRGASGARVQDLYDRWHDAVTGEGAWLAVLPHEGRGGPPPVEFLAEDGSVLRREAPPSDAGVVGWVAVSREPVDHDEDALAEFRAVVEHASVTALWVEDSPTTPELLGWGGDDEGASSITLGDGTLEVDVDGDRDDVPEDVARELVERLLQSRLGRRAAARAVIEAAMTPLPGSIEGREETFALVAALGAWAAAWWDRRTLLVTASGTGEPPARLDLVPARI